MKRAFPSYTINKHIPNNNNAPTKQALMAMTHTSKIQNRSWTSLGIWWNPLQCLNSPLPRIGGSRHSSEWISLQWKSEWISSLCGFPLTQWEYKSEWTHGRRCILIFFCSKVILNFFHGSTHSLSNLTGHCYSSNALVDSNLSVLLRFLFSDPETNPIFYFTVVWSQSSTITLLTNSWGPISLNLQLKFLPVRCAILQELRSTIRYDLWRWRIHSPVFLKSQSHRSRYLID